MSLNAKRVALLIEDDYQEMEAWYPFYRLTEVLRDFPQLANAQRMTVAESFANARLHLWDEKTRRLLSYAEAYALRRQTA